MHNKIILVYCLCDDYLRYIDHVDNEQCRVSTAEVLTVAIISALEFFGHQDKTRSFLKHYGYIPHMISKSRLTRRLHMLDESIWEGLLYVLREAIEVYEKTHEYIVDSFPVASCQNVRIGQARRLKGREYHGRASSKRAYFYGLKVNMLISKGGFPVEVHFSPGSHHDMASFKSFNLDIPPGSIIYADKAYTNYAYEDFIQEAAGIKMLTERNRNLRRQLTHELRFMHSKIRKKIEIAFSQITRLFPRSIHAVTSKGFQMKIMNFILAYTVNLFLKEKFALS